MRVNKKRCSADYRLLEHDLVRIPPLRLASPAQSECLNTAAYTAARLKTLPIIFEDDALLVIDKPVGRAVHGGSGISLGVIEQLRLAHPHYPFLELVHRLDRDTSGLLILAKKRAALLNLHQQIREQKIDKRYLVCVAGQWRTQLRVVTIPLMKYLTQTGERRTKMHPDGQNAVTEFYCQRQLSEYALLEAKLKTGRMHQIRAHLAALHYPIIGDDKYGDFILNHKIKNLISRMFLHAWRLDFRHPTHNKMIHLEAPLPLACQQFLDSLT